MVFCFVNHHNEDGTAVLNVIVFFRFIAALDRAVIKGWPIKSAILFFFFFLHKSSTAGIKHLQEREVGCALIR